MRITAKWVKERIEEHLKDCYLQSTSSNYYVINERNGHSIRDKFTGTIKECDAFIDGYVYHKSKTS